MLIERGSEVGVHQHVGQAAIAVERMLGMEREDGFAFPGFEPMIARHERALAAPHPAAQVAQVTHDQQDRVGHLAAAPERSAAPRLTSG